VATLTDPSYAAAVTAAASDQATLRALVVDDEAHARSELAFLLRRDLRIGDVQVAATGAEALRVLASNQIDVVFCDIKMPGMDGLDLGRILTQFARPPQVVFVTAYDEHAVDAFELRATDYVMKPVRSARLAEAIRRVAAGTSVTEPETPAIDETIAVELGGVTRFVRRSDVRYVEAQGDYARLHTQDDAHLVRIPLSSLAERWAAAGFVRIHRSTLVNLRFVEEVRSESGHYSVRIAQTRLPVSRRHARDRRARLLHPDADPARSGGEFDS
jgi:DNA-binding LytR/AlgR family response regulator